MRKSAAVYTTVYRFVLFSSFTPLLPRAVATEIVGIENCLDVLEAVAGEGGDQWHRRFGECSANHSRTSEIMKREAADAGAGAGFGP